MIFKNILLAYQLENYRHIRFLRFIYSHPKFWIYGSKRQTLEYTAKAKLILVLSLFFVALDFFASFYFLSDFYTYLNIFLIVLLLPLYFIVSNILLYPLDRYLKNKIVGKAKAKISQFQDLKVIAITGSYGKTTTKEILGTILSESFSVLITEGTKNTPLGISRLILDELTEKHRVFIVEMGAYNKGDIAELCDIVGPNISIITGITAQHLERFKSIDNIIDAKFEILEALGKNDIAIVDSSTAGVQKGLKEKKLEVENIIEIKRTLPYTYKENLSGITFEIAGEQIDTKLLARYIGNTLQICLEVSQQLGQDIEAFKTGVSKIDFVEHRMQLIYNPGSNVYVLDDSFNGNLEGIDAILDLMENAPFSGRKILIAGGVVELGDQTQSVHLGLGPKMGKVSDLILLVEGPVGNAIEKGLLESNYPSEKIKKYNTPLELHSDLGNIIQSGDMVVFQNDLPDHYL